MIGASLLSVVFLVYGAFARVWSVAAVGQLFLALAVYHFFLPPNHGIFPWTWLAAAVPVMVIFFTARAAQEWLKLFTDTPEAWREPLRLLAYGYFLLALVALIRWVFGVIPVSEQVAAFLFLGTLVLSTSVRHGSSFGIRCSFVLSLIGIWLYLDNLPTDAHAMATYLNGFAMLLLLAQTGLLRHEGKSFVTLFESWALILLAVATSWIFVSAWVWTRFSPNDLTIGWALFALFLYIVGQLIREPRLARCGLAIVAMAILRVCFYDIWGMPNGYRVPYFSYSCSDHARNWLHDPAPDRPAIPRRNKNIPNIL